ncbi:MAG: sugar phosphate isomerase/epimerase family protein [Hominenteromicrobium sp.]
MNKMKAAMIGFLPKDKDPYETLESYAKVGYRAFEGGDLLLEGDPAENLKRVQSFGMQPLAVHYNAWDPPDTADIIRNAHAAGVTRAACYAGIAGAYRFGMRETPPTYDDILREAEQFDKAAEALGREGIVLSFHNHDAEFIQTINGVPVIYLMAANTQYLKFEVDCGWVTYAGHDPIAFMKNLGSRLTAVHIKDFVPGEVVQEGGGRKNVMPRFTTPGTGVLNLKGCLETASELGMEWAIVEQDFQYNLTELETLTAAYYNMKESGFVC